MRFGPSYPCISCHQTLFRHQVLDFKLKLREKITARCSDSLYNKAFSVFLDSSPEVQEIKLDRSKQITFVNGDEAYFLCKVCLSYLQKSKLPPKAAVNCLEVVPVPENVRLRSYLEEALIARVLLFIKIFALRTSLMPAMNCLLYTSPSPRDLP